MKCKICGKEIEQKILGGRLIVFYELCPLTIKDKILAKKLGIPHRTYKIHICSKN